MPQSQLSEQARRVLEVDEERFRELVRELARGAFLVRFYVGKNQLESRDIVLGHISPGVRMYEAVVEVPSCRQNYNDSRGVFYASVSWTTLQLEFGVRQIAKTNQPL